MKLKKLMILLTALVTSTMLLVACEPNAETNSENKNEIIYC